MKKSFERAQRRDEKGIHYKHDLGQHFLYDEELLSRLVERCAISPEEGVLEIGPGAGTLTRCLCRAAKSVLAVEADSDIIPYLKAATLNENNLTIVEGDIRRVDLKSLTLPLSAPFAVIANIPYNITSPIFDLLFSSELPIHKIGLMVQKEVAQKLFAAPSTEGYGPLSLRRGYAWRYLFSEELPATLFTPPPKVDSTFLCIEKDEGLAKARDEKHLWLLIKIAFCQRRKTLLNALKGLENPSRIRLALKANGLTETARAEELSIGQWISLSDTLVRLASEASVSKEG